jgi:hypothetical protein
MVATGRRNYATIPVDDLFAQIRTKNFPPQHTNA